MCLRSDEIDEELIAGSRIFHFGSLSMTHPQVREATRSAIHVAEKNGCVRSFDPNLREPLWDSSDSAKEQIAYGMEHCDILKISDNELLWFTNAKDFDTGIRELSEKYHIRMILLSMGKEGSCVYYEGKKVSGKAFIQKDTIETTGAGDTFFACVLNYILEHGLEGLKETELCEMLTFANAAASIITTRKGALRVMPRKEEIEELINPKFLLT